METRGDSGTTRVAQEAAKASRVGRRERLGGAAAWLLFLLGVDLLLGGLFSMARHGSDGAGPLDLRAVVASYRETALEFADVRWHVELVESGYTRLDAAEATPAFWTRQRNWAFFPLTPLLARPLAAATGSPFWALWLVSRLALIGLALSAEAWARAALPDRRARWTARFLLAGFAVPALGYSVNFVVLPMFLMAAAAGGLRRWLSTRRSGWLAIAVAACALLGFSRAQGLVFNAGLLAWGLWARGARFDAVGADGRRISPGAGSLLIGANLLPFVGIGLFYWQIAGDPLAFQKIQAAWGRGLAAPWTPWLAASRSEAAFVALRYATFGGFIAVALAALGAGARSTGRSRVADGLDATFVLLALVLLALPLFSGTLLSAHRYASFAFLALAVHLSRGPPVPLAVLGGLLALRSAELVLFANGARFLIW